MKAARGFALHTAPVVPDLGGRNDVQYPVCLHYQHRDIVYVWRGKRRVSAKYGVDIRSSENAVEK